MKKLILLFVMMLIMISTSFAQHLKKDGTPDRRYKENKTYINTSKSSVKSPYRKSKTYKTKTKSHSSKS